MTNDEKNHCKVKEKFVFLNNNLYTPAGLRCFKIKVL